LYKNEEQKIDIKQPDAQSLSEAAVQELNLSDELIPSE